MKVTHLTIFTLLSVLGLAALSVYLFAFMHYQTDSQSYLNALKMIMGQAIDSNETHRIVKPASFLIPLLLYRLGLPMIYGFFAQQWISYGFSAYFIFRLMRALNFNPRSAFAGMFAYLSCQTVAIFNFALTMDGVGWMMEILGLYWSCLLLKKLANKGRLPVLFCLKLGLIFGVGMLIKESVLMAGLYLFLGVAFNGNNFKQKIMICAIIGFSFLSIFIGANIYIEIYYHKSILSWWKFAHTAPPTYAQPFKAYFVQTARTLDLHWFLVILGLGIALKDFKKMNPRLSSLFITAFLGLGIFPLAWPYLTDRIIFMVTLLLIPALALATEKLPKVALVFVIFGGILNLWMSYQIYYHKQTGYLLKTALVYVGVLCLCLVLNYCFFKKSTS